MIVIISPENPFVDETVLINSFFENGLSLFHIRKNLFSDDEMKSYLTGIDVKFRSQIVLRSNYRLANEFGVHRLHFREKECIKQTYLGYATYKLSTSVHRIKDFNMLSEIWQYAFLSPVFPSISKSGYGKGRTVLNDLKQKNNPHVQLIGLGGIQIENCQQVIENGADGIALLGAVWQSKDPINTFLQCMKNVQQH